MAIPGQMSPFGLTEKGSDSSAEYTLEDLKGADYSWINKRKENPTKKSRRTKKKSTRTKELATTGSPITSTTEKVDHFY